MNRFFIIGSPRSGTTLFRLMLNKHKGIVVPPEAGFMAWLYDRYRYFSITMIDDFVIELSETRKFKSWNIETSLLKVHILKSQPKNYSELIDSVYFYYAQQVLGKEFELMGDKNNFYLNEIEKINKMYPSCRFIHIVRDGRSVAVSYKGLASRGFSSLNAPKLSGNIEEIANVWKNDMEVIERSFENIAKQRVQCIRFEDLVLSADDTLKAVSEFLEVEYDSEMLNYYLTTESEGLEPKEFLAWKEKNSSPLLPEEAYKYRQLGVDERNIFEKICQVQMRKYGYIGGFY